MWKSIARLIPIQVLFALILGWVPQLKDALNGPQASNYATTTDWIKAISASVDAVKAAPGTLRGYIINGLGRCSSNDQVTFAIQGINWFLDGIMSIS